MSGSPAGRGGKSRIVIDVDKIQRETRGRKSARLGRGAKVLSVAAVAAAGLLLLAAVGGYLWWSSYKKGPSYSLALLIDAAQRDDVQTVEQLIDGDQVAQGLVPQVVEKLTGGAVSAPGANAALRPQIEAAMPQLAPRVREVVRDEVARGVKGVSAQTGGDLPFVLLALGIRRYADVREEGDAAAVTLNAEGRTMELNMRRSDDRWKIVTLKDDALASSIAARIAPSVPAGVAPPVAAPTPRPGRRRPQR